MITKVSDLLLTDRLIDTKEVERAHKYVMTYVGSYVHYILGMLATTHTLPCKWKEGEKEERKKMRERQ